MLILSLMGSLFWFYSYTTIKMHLFLSFSIWMNKRFPVLSTIMTYHRVCNKIYTTGATSGTRTAYASGSSEFTPCFYWSSCCSIFSFMCMFCRSLFVLFLLVILLSVLRYTDYDYHFGIFKLFKQKTRSKISCTYSYFYFKGVLCWCFVCVIVIIYLWFDHLSPH